MSWLVFKKNHDIRCPTCKKMTHLSIHEAFVNVDYLEEHPSLLFCLCGHSYTKENLMDNGVSLIKAPKLISNIKIAPALEALIN